MILSVTGHRPQKLGGFYTPNPVYDHVIKGLTDALGHFRPDYVITGMALGVDQWMAELCIKYGIPFVAAIPHDGHDAIWPAHVQAKYRAILAQAHTQYIISPGPYTASKMHARNRYLVDSCDQLVAVWDGTKGGTASCVAYAQSRRKPIHFVPLAVPTERLPTVGSIESSPPPPLRETSFAGREKRPSSTDLPKFSRKINIE